MKINDTIFNVDLETILNELVTQLRINNISYISKMKESGNSIQITCPYHNDGMERKPSAGIRKSDGMFHCFACNEVHTLPEVISYCLGYTDDALGKEGWKWLVKNFATIQVEERKDIELDFTRTGSSHDSMSNDSKHTIGRYVTEEELDTYRYTHPYWAKRKITSDYIIELFDLGYDKKTSCITFPVRDISGNCLFVARRSVKTKFFNYPEGVEKPLYGLYELTIQQERYSEIIVCESMLDALTCWEYGKYAVALNGLGNDLQFKQLRELPCRKLILATDNDNAGQEARKRIRQHIKYKLITEYVLPENRKDINELSREEFDNLEEIF